MKTDRYLKIILTVIALELFWIGVRDLAPPASAQTAAATPVIIRGVNINENESRGTLPVDLVKNVNHPLKIDADQPLRIEANRPLQIAQPVKIETDRPLKVENAGYSPSQRPGE